MSKKEEYVVRGFTCANCASQFERNVQNIHGVTEAKVNFAASKVTVKGEATIEQIEEAGAFEDLKILKADQRIEEDHTPFWKKAKNIRVMIAAVLTFAGWVLLFQAGESHPLTITIFVIAVAIGGYRLFWQGLRNLLKFEFTMRTLMTIAIIGAGLIGEWGEAAIVVVLFALSEALESYSMEKARKSLRNLIDLAPRYTVAVRGNKEITVPVKDIRISDTLIVKPGENIPADGIVTEGSTTINEAAITGESIPAFKKTGDEVFAGTLNEEGLIKLEVSKGPEDTALAKIIHLVEEAQQEKAPAQQFIDRFAMVYTPAIMILAALIAMVPPLLFQASWGEWVYLGLATLVVGCPCALIISTPVAIVTAIGHSAHEGVLIKGGLHMEQAGKINAVAFDKTGTLTKGEPAVTDVVLPDGEKKENLLPLAYAIEKYSNHPLGKAVVRYTEKEDPEITENPLLIEGLENLPGRGIRGKAGNEEVFAASPEYVMETFPGLYSKDIETKVESLLKEGKTIIVIGSQKKVLGLFALQDEVKTDSYDSIKDLEALGIKKIVMLTGDHLYTAEAAGKEAGITDVRARLMPEDKLSVIRQLKNKGYNVGMVGDGVNDAPALAAADVSIAMGKGGTDAALETADISLMGDDLTKLPYTIRLSRKTMKVIKQNIIFSFVLKLAALMLVPFGLLTLWIAIFADIGATLLVTLNSLRLMKIKR
ncbi:heavy metal translocating P-type ATPase [Alteribacter keqinensis]|uniref:Cd(2+)-exporting ATPase n=1 Tax=Alteribacter keqinensis TaxID=2483800 RepID=A0A3M7TLH1_9BACI|nr:heavy metal translocating P-type ATPase [Alteribacter keqinensis]RNA66321.1 cadmium-translocating P-type ATPase [Alteribacter keqinensis]